MFGDDKASLSAEVLASVFMKRVSQGLYSIESDKKIDALQMYDWLQEELNKNYDISLHWKILMHDEGRTIFTTVLHILSTTQDSQLQLMAVKALNFLAKGDNITDIIIIGGGMPLVIGLLLSRDENLFLETLKLSKRLVESRHYLHEKTAMIHYGLIDVLCFAFVNWEDSKTLETIAELCFSFFDRFNRYGKAPKREVTQVCRVMNLMLQQTEGVLGDESVQVACLRKVHWHECFSYWPSFVESGLIATLTQILVTHRGSKTNLREEAMTILNDVASEEPVAKVMLDGGILESIFCGDTNKIDQHDINLLANMLISSDDVKSYCIRGGLVEHVLKLMENSDTADHLKYGLFRILDNVFQPNAKNVPQECIECLLPIFVRSLKSPDGNIVPVLSGLAGMTATYDGDQFENVDRLMDCGVLPQIVEMIGSPESSVNATALLLASNLAFSGKKPVIQALLDAGVLANALSALNSAVSHYVDHYQVEVAKLVMYITVAGFGKDVVHEQTRCFGVLLKKLNEKQHVRNKEESEMQLLTYTYEDLINFGSHILETRDINQIKVLLSIDNFDIFIVNYPEELDPLKDKKLKVLKKTVDIIRELGYRRIFCFHAYILSDLLEKTPVEETKSLLTYVLDGLCSDRNREELMSS